MTRDDIIRMAQEAGIKIEIDWAGRPSTIVIKDGATYLRGVHELERFAALVAAAEREACAKVCESLITDGDIYPGNFVLEACAKSIRSKSE